MRLITLMASAALVAGAAARLPAQEVVYDNGAPAGVDGRDISRSIWADDFLLTASASFDQIRFWTIEGIPGYSGNGIQWWIFAAGSQPGSILYSGIATPTRSVPEVHDFCCLKYQNDLFISSLSLDAGHYWLGLHEGADYDDRFVFWETTANANTSTFSIHSSNRGTMDNWTATDLEFAFQLINGDDATTVPEPASLALLATGLVGVIAARHRFRRGRRTAPRIRGAVSPSGLRAMS